MHHNYQTPSVLADIDVAYFDLSDLSTERDVAIQNRLTIEKQVMQWEVTNQAAVHTWFEAAFGYPVAPLESLYDAVASWPEFATAVGLSLRDDNQIEVIAPYGLEDLFGMTVRRNPARVSADIYRKRVEQKQYRDRWPNVTITDC